MVTTIVSLPVLFVPIFQLNWNCFEAASYFMHDAPRLCAPVAENSNRHPEAATSAFASASLSRPPFAPVSWILIGTVCPAFHLEFGAGERNPAGGAKP
jgi:hypothetical protein